MMHKKSESELKVLSLGPKIILRSNYISSIPKILNHLDMSNKDERKIIVGSSPQSKEEQRSLLPFRNGKKMRLFSAAHDTNPQTRIDS